MTTHLPYLQCRLTAALVVLGTLTLAVDAGAQGGGPTQVEFTTPPVPPGPSVNEFTGDFTYGLPILTVPGPNGSGYSMTLSYHAGTNPNADVSWVGYGWSLNPGAIVRNQRGYADDFDGDVNLVNKRPVDYVVSSEQGITAEIASGDLFSSEVLQTLGLSAGIDHTIRYDSRTGYGEIIGPHTGVSLMGNYAGLTHMSDNGEGGFSGVLSLNPLATAMQADAIAGGNLGGASLMERKQLKLISKHSAISFTLFGGNDFSMSPPAQVGFSGSSSNSKFKIQISATNGVFTGGNIGTSINVTEIRTWPSITRRALGYMHSDRAGSDKDALMDYYYEKDVPFIMDDELLPIPFGSPDLFSVVGGGTFRLHNRGLSSFRQNYSNSILSIDNNEDAFTVGAAFGYGKHWGSGSIRYRSQEWPDHESNVFDRHSWQTEGDEPMFFRYLGERGGTLLYDDNDDPQMAWIQTDLNLGTFLLELLAINDADRYARLPNSVSLQLNPWERPERTGYIGYTTNPEMLLSSNDRYYHSYERDEETRSKVSSRSSMPDGIGEFAL